MPPQTCIQVATVGQRAYAVSVDQARTAAIALAMATLGPHLSIELCGYTGPVQAGGPAEWIIPSVRSYGVVAARRQIPLPIAEDEYSVTTNVNTSALVPWGSGAVHVDVTLFCRSEVDFVSFDPATDITSPLYVQILWMAVGGADPEPVLASVTAWFESFGLALDQDEVENVELPDVLLSEQIAVLQDQLSYRDQMLEGLAASTSAKALRAAVEERRRLERKLTGHVKQLQMELDTARAVSGRLRTRAEAAERQQRESLSTNTPTSPAPIQALGQTEISAQTEHLALVVQQQSAELDRLRGELFRMREDRQRDRGVLREVTETLLPPAPPPASLQGLASWAQATLGGRIVIHPKAARAARKSAFADPALVYRVLQAMSDHYWTMRSSGDAGARAVWEAFLATERLACGPTGAAVQDRRTRAAYLVAWHRRSVELDQHIQGDSSRDESRTFRLYFHWDADRAVIVVGHLPSHLPNTFS